MFGNSIRAALTHALTQYDVRQEKLASKPGRYHNPYALAQYLGRIDDVCADIADGASPRDAVTAAFTGAVLKCALKAIEAAPATPDEFSGAGKFTYQPASNR